MPTNNTEEFLLSLANEVIMLRAAKDGCEPNDYDAHQDPEGYITSLLTAIHLWCRVNKICWEEELRRAQGFFEQDLETGTDPSRFGRLHQSVCSSVSPLPEPTVQHLCCPKCGQQERFIVEPNKCLLMVSHGSIEDRDLYMEWGNQSSCRCRECGHCGIVHEFHSDKPTTKP